MFHVEQSRGTVEKRSAFQRAFCKGSTRCCSTWNIGGGPFRPARKEVPYGLPWASVSRGTFSRRPWEPTLKAASSGRPVWQSVGVTLGGGPVVDARGQRGSTSN